LVILILLLLGLVFFMGTVIPEFFVLVIFFIIMGLPVIILLRKKLYKILPNIISDSLVEIDNRQEEEDKTKNTYSISLMWKQVLMFIFIVLLIIGSVYYLKKFKADLTEKKSIVKFLGSFVCATIAGITLLEIDKL
jgi:H+/gluconate symporter-like permease